MPQLNGSRTQDNPRHAFAAESQANPRYMYFARRADIEGYPDIGGLFRDTAEAETGNAFGHMDFLEEVGDPATGFAIGGTDLNLKSAVEVAAGREAALQVEHGAYRARQVLPEETVEELISDLDAGE